jgi:uroporphyrinogen decarboxylase
MGAHLDFIENRGPVFSSPIRDEAAVDRLVVPDPELELTYVLDTIRILRRELADKVPLIGFSGAPFTLATYLIEGGGSKTYWQTKKMMYQAPALYKKLLEKITACTISYLQAQAAAGAQALQIFDSWAGVLAPDDYAEFALPYVQWIIRELKDTGVPLIYFANNGATLLEMAKTSGADVLGLDWRVTIEDAVARLGQGVSLQGNLDPIALLLPEDKLAAKVERIIAQGRKARGHIFNLGHGIQPETPPEKAKLVVRLVHELSGKGRA